MSTPETTTAHRCTFCDTLWTLDDLVRCYECGDCGEVSDERRCESCHKFKSRADFTPDSLGCPDCFAETEEVDAVTDHDGSLIVAADYDPNPSAAAEKAAREDAERARALAARTASARRVRVGELEPGDQLMHGVKDQPFGTSAPVVYVVPAGTPDMSVVHVARTTGALGAYVAPSDAIAYCNPDKAAPGKVARVDGNLYPVEVNTDQVGMVMGDPKGAFTVIVGTHGGDDDPLPSLSIQVGRQHVAIIGHWVDPVLAGRALDALERAAQQLAQARYGAALTGDDLPGFRVITGDWVSANLTGVVPGVIGRNMYADDDTDPMMNLCVGTNEVCLDDPAGLLAAVREARAHLGHLTLTPGA